MSSILTMTALLDSKGNPTKASAAAYAAARDLGRELGEADAARPEGKVGYARKGAELRKAFTDLGAPFSDDITFRALVSQHGWKAPKDGSPKLLELGEESKAAREAIDLAVVMLTDAYAQSRGNEFNMTYKVETEKGENADRARENLTIAQKGLRAKAQVANVGSFVRAGFRLGDRLEDVLSISDTSPSFAGARGREALISGVATKVIEGLLKSSNKPLAVKAVVGGISDLVEETDNKAKAEGTKSDTPNRDRVVREMASLAKGAKALSAFIAARTNAEDDGVPAHIAASLKRKLGSIMNTVIDWEEKPQADKPERELRRNGKVVPQPTAAEKAAAVAEASGEDLSI